MFERKLPISSGVYYYIFRLVDFCFSSLSDRHTQRLLREISNQELALAMKALGGDACKKLHDNLPKRLRTAIIEEHEVMGPVRQDDIAEVDDRIFRWILKLGEMGEIAVPGYLNRIFESNMSNEDYNEGVISIDI